MFCRRCLPTSHNKLKYSALAAALFANQIMGRCLYLAACPYGTPAGQVSELDGDMVLLSVGPYSNGFTLPEQAATRESVTSYRASVAKAAADRVFRQKAEEEVKGFMALLRLNLGARISRCSDPVLRSELESAISSSSELSLEKVAAMCLKLGIGLQALVRD